MVRRECVVRWLHRISTVVFIASLVLWVAGDFTGFMIEWRAGASNYRIGNSPPGCVYYHRDTAKINGDRFHISLGLPNKWYGFPWQGLIPRYVYLQTGIELVGLNIPLWMIAAMTGILPYRNWRHRRRKQTPTSAENASV